MSAPLVLIATSWSPALALSVADCYRRLHAAGTPSFHESTALLWEHSVIALVLCLAGPIAWVGYVGIVLRPSPRRDGVVWLLGIAVVVAYFANGPSFDSLNRDRVLLFEVIPLVVAALSVVGAWATWRAARVDPMVALRAA
jgi:hypothetical protein